MTWDEQAAARRANDGEVPIASHYGPLDRDLPPHSTGLSSWALARAAGEPPYRPRFMVYSGIGSPDTTARRLRLLQDIGAESFLVAADLPSQLGFDPDHELAHAQVGRAGVSCSTLADMHALCADLDLDIADSVGMLANSLGHVGMGMVLSMLSDRGSRAGLVMQNDPLKEYTARGTEIHQPDDAVRIACDCVAYAIEQNLPGVAMTVCSNHYDVAGAGPILGMALAFANAIVYMDELVGRGYAPEAVAGKLMFFLNERSNFFVEAAVFRVARDIWAELLAERYGCHGVAPVSLMGYAHGLESAAEPLVNMPRCTMSVLASMMGGVDYLCATSYDEALRTPSGDAAALAVRTMQVVAHEHGAADTVDPLAGSYKMRDIADYVHAQVTAELKQLAEQGGGIAALNNGYIQQRIDEHRGAREGQLARGDRVMVGHTRYEAAEHRALFAGRSASEIDFRRIEAEQVDSIRRQKAERDQSFVTHCLGAVRDVAASTDNLLPATIEALRAGATTGELVAATGAGFAR